VKLTASKLMSISFGFKLRIIFKEKQEHGKSLKMEI